MKRREFLGSVAALALGARMPPALAAARDAAFHRVRPGDPAWPTDAQWRKLGQRVNGRLLRLHSPFDACSEDAAACQSVFARLANPYDIGDDPALTQTLGWANAWNTAASEWAVAAETPADVAVAIDFARRHRLRLVVKGGGHSYQGTSCSKDSLLVWTRHMNAIHLHDAFVPDGCAGFDAAGTGSLHRRGRRLDARLPRGHGASRALRAGRRLRHGRRRGPRAERRVRQLLEGLRHGGGGPRRGGSGDGRRRAPYRQCLRDPELFWALKGGGGGSFGVVTQLTLRTHELPETVGAVFGTITRAQRWELSRARRAVHGATIAIASSTRIGANRSSSTMASVMRAFHGVPGAHARGGRGGLAAFPGLARRARRRVSMGERLLESLEVPARRLWDVDYLQEARPRSSSTDTAPARRAENSYWAGDGGQAGQFLTRIAPPGCPRRCCGRTPARTRRRARRREPPLAIFPAFQQGPGRRTGRSHRALARHGDESGRARRLRACHRRGGARPGASPAFPGMSRISTPRARRRTASTCDGCVAGCRAARRVVCLRKRLLRARLAALVLGRELPATAGGEAPYDPDGLFFVHHGVGSEAWSPDGFTRLAST